jgi:hypothetical protein
MTSNILPEDWREIDMETLDPSDQNDAHEFIWLIPEQGDPMAGEWTWTSDLAGVEDEEAAAAMPYVRRDPAVIAALPEVQAMVADALERAAKAAGTYCWNRYASKDEGGQLSSPAVFTSHTHQDIDRAIRAMIPADHAAALAARDERMRAEGRKEGMERAAGRLDLRHRNYMQAKGRNPDDYGSEYSLIAADIRAEIGGEA